MAIHRPPDERLLELIIQRSSTFPSWVIMLSYTRATGLLAAFGAAVLPLAQADCPDLPGCDALGPPPIGSPGGLDPHDPNALAVYALNCPCYSGEILDCSVTYTGTTKYLLDITICISQQPLQSPVS
ncbi:hypothetical protein F5Y16DRAFT_399160 [Xylariaceae sp. FL0255]|nr:hypothetical protein F5Y16DRAFT_399160 [Xylariaceae sp. FL0255]